MTDLLARKRLRESGDIRTALRQGYDWKTLLEFIGPGDIRLRATFEYCPRWILPLSKRRNLVILAAEEHGPERGKHEVSVRDMAIICGKNAAWQPPGSTTGSTYRTFWVLQAEVPAWIIAAIDQFGLP